MREAAIKHAIGLLQAASTQVAVIPMTNNKDAAELMRAVSLSTRAMILVVRVAIRARVVADPIGCAASIEELAKAADKVEMNAIECEVSE